ncbi:GreA/GreB family elongation factor [Chitinophaga sp. GCM10012297]|uniref:GreA/GreB family elongation factor n=1 Tax=Chitinophaga chungangae TaxID=2821488 RepID=A0ABS3YAV9_9BACT|nr:GreA/GreB family elongation factor [Chitinophaga chungangae]MBO9151815.1 GreA/GreB family elongation factor [Chitinophaga chungangae]
MQKTKTNMQPVFRKDDFEILQACLQEDERVSTFTPDVVESLLADFRKGKLVSKEEFPSDVVRLNSRVVVQEANRDKEMEITIVMPEEADIKQRKISVMAPVGVALIGFRQGQEVMWPVHGGNKKFRIKEVINDNE